MSHKVTFTFTLSNWTETDVKTSKKTPTRFTVASEEREYTGDLIGWGPTNYGMSYYSEPGAAPDQLQCAWAGLSLFDGTVLGKKGSFAMNTSGIFDKGDLTGSLVVSAETTTGELKGMSGEGGFATMPSSEAGKWMAEGHLTLRWNGDV